MIQLKDTRHRETADFLTAAIGIARYYGFVPLETLPKQPPRHGGDAPKQKLEDEILFARRDERSLLPAARRAVTGMPPQGQTALAWRITGGTATAPATLELHVLGAPSTIAEAFLIVVGDAIAEDAGIRGRSLTLNNVGSPESFGRFARDVGTYLRKHIDSISPTLRPRAATDPLGTLVQLIEREHPAVPRAPQAMEYLTEEERRRFWELLEYLEAAEIDYELNGQLLGSRDVWTHALFELSATDPETGLSSVFASGGRYDPLASRIARSPVSAAVLSIACESRGREFERPAAAHAAIPAIYFAHLGNEARRRTLSVLENLRKASIPVHQGHWHERIGDQMAVARQTGVPYILIMGHKEAMEGTILVREVATNSQEAIPAPDIVSYLKRHRIGVPRPERATASV